MEATQLVTTELRPKAGSEGRRDKEGVMEKGSPSPGAGFVFFPPRLPLTLPSADVRCYVSDVRMTMVWHG